MMKTIIAKRECSSANGAIKQLQQEASHKLFTMLRAGDPLCMAAMSTFAQELAKTTNR
jgi:hypothetical protein